MPSFGGRADSPRGHGKERDRRGMRAHGACVLTGRSSRALAQSSGLASVESMICGISMAVATLSFDLSWREMMAEPDRLREHFTGEDLPGDEELE